MTRYSKLLGHFSGSVATALLGAAALTSSPAAAVGPCNGPAGTGSDTTTMCYTAVAIPGVALRSFDISWVNETRSEYYLADRSTSGVDIISTRSLKFLRTIPGFAGIVPTTSMGVSSTLSGPNGVTAHGNWLYAGDGNSTLHTINLTALPLNNPPQTVVGTGGKTRLDEMALTPDGLTLIAANNAENPPFATVFTACGDSTATTCTPTSKGTVKISSALLPAGFGLGLEQPIWDDKTKRFYVSVPTIANNPAGCNYGQLSSGVTCSGGMAVIDPTASFPQTLGPFDPVAFSGVVPLQACNPSGIAGIPNDMIMLSCSAAPVTVMNDSPPFNFAEVFNIGGADEIWWNPGSDKRYYLGASKHVGTPGPSCVQFTSSGSPIPPTTQCPALGVVDITSVLLETIPVSSGSHSVAADSNQNYIFVPQVGTIPIVGIGGDTTTNGAAICGTNNGCVAVYQHNTQSNPNPRP